VRVLATGAFGFLGLALSRRLVADGHEVIAFGHPPRSPRAREVVPPAARVVEGDVLEIAALLAETRPEAIVHLAGGGGPARVEQDPALAVRVNVLGTSRLVEAARVVGVRRLLFASTIQVYGVHRDMGRPYRETDATAADDLYGAVKEAAEHVVTAAGGTALRLANLYGAGAGVDLGISGAVERFARAAAAGGEITVYGSGAQTIDYLHVDDACAAFAAALTVAEPPPIVNVGGGKPVAIGGLASACLGAAHRLGRTPRIVAREPPPGPVKSWPDRSLAIGLAQNRLGWRPQVQLQAGIDALVAMMARSTP
jgi:UDP-glucose 4-epimerase